MTCHTASPYRDDDCCTRWTETSLHLYVTWLRTLSKEQAALERLASLLQRHFCSVGFMGGQLESRVPSAACCDNTQRNLQRGWLFAGGADADPAART